MQAGAVELFQLADEGALIGGTAAVLFACTLIVRLLKLRKQPCSVGIGTELMTEFYWFVLLQGLAVGFVLLRVEALVEEGKI